MIFSTVAGVWIFVGGFIGEMTNAFTPGHAVARADQAPGVTLVRTCVTSMTFNCSASQATRAAARVAAGPFRPRPDTDVRHDFSLTRSIPRGCRRRSSSVSAILL